jgi:peptidoglycan/xylan/chitin deacetylase (PgdA/CDA1 family)
VAQPGVAPRPALPKSPPELLFTFDDGPHLERTPKVLDILDRHHIKAVFFVNGVHFQGHSSAAEKARAILRDIVRRGHAVGNHTVHHFFLCGSVYSKRTVEEVEDNAKLIEDAIGQRPELFRTPFGAHCPALAATLAKLGVKHTGWDIDPQDWKLQNTVKVRDYVERWLRNMKSGRQILLMHDIHQCSVEALPQILDWLDKENAERVQRGEPPIRVIDYAYLLPPHPAVPPILDGIGRVLIDVIAPAPALRLLALVAGPPRRS